MTSGDREFSSVSLDDLADLRDFVQRTGLSMGASEDEIGDLVIAANEAVENLIIHGYLDKPGVVRVILEAKDGSIILRIFDRSPRFDPTTVQVPDISKPLDQRLLGGLGVHMMRSFTDDMLYSTSPSGENELVLIKRLSDS